MKGCITLNMGGDLHQKGSAVMLAKNFEYIVGNVSYRVARVWESQKNALNYEGVLLGEDIRTDIHPKTKGVRIYFFLTKKGSLLLSYRFILPKYERAVKALASRMVELIKAEHKAKHCESCENLEHCGGDVECSAQYGLPSPVVVATMPITAVIDDSEDC